MNKFFRSFLYILTISAVLLMSVMGTTTVYAEGGTDEDPVVTEPPAEPPETTEAEEPPTEVQDESPPESEESPAEVVNTVPEVLEQVPEGTELVIINEEGDSEPLVTQVAAEILVEGDPVWCPEGQVPTPGANGCTASHTGFDDLIVDLTGGTYSGDGVIWVESSYDANEDNAAIVFDGTSGNLANLSNVSVLGGWNGTSGSTSLDPTNPSLLDDALAFTNWTGNVSIFNLEFQDADDSGAGALTIETDGDITLDNISIDNNPSGHGAYLDNCLNTGTCGGSGEVTVTDSSFSNNNNAGLVVVSSENMTIKNVTADNNNQQGIVLDTDYGISNDVKVIDVTVTNNGNDGVHIYDVDGNVTLKDITATNNGDGVEVDSTRGNISGSNITATGNFNDGVDINNTSGSLILSNVTASNNDDNGFEINNVDGAIKLYCITASENGTDGVYINADGNVTIKCSTITDNTDDGVDIELAPTAQLLSVTNTGNADQDVEVDPLVTTVTIKNVDCSSKKKSTHTAGEKSLFTKLYCLPGEIKVALYDTYGDMIEFENLCGYEAGVFDPSSWAYPETIPGGGDDYITSLQDKMLEEIPGLEPVTEYGMPGVLAQVLDELPFMLPDGFSYASAFFTAVLDEGELLDPLPEDSGLTVRFRVPAWLDPFEELSILWWDGAEWVDLGGEYSEDGYYFQINTEETGVFVLSVYEVEN
jgi:hypothetical protein